MPTFDSTAVKFDSSAITWDQTVDATPAPVFSVQPSITPTSGTVGTEFTADDGEASDTTSYTRRWLLDDVEIGTGATVTPEAAGSLVLEVTATGPGGSTVATSDPVTVSAVPTPTPSPAFRGGMGFGIGIGLSGFITMGGGSGGSPTPTPTPTDSVARGDTSRLSASGLAKRNEIVDAVDAGLWTGYDASIHGPIDEANSKTASTFSQLWSEMSAAATRNPNGWNEIVLSAAGTWTSSDQEYFGGLTPGPQFGDDGGVLVRSVDGETVILSGNNIRPSCRGLHLKNLTFAQAAGIQNNTFSLRLISSGSESTAHRIVLDSCNFGTLFYPGKTIADRLEFGIGVKLNACESVYVMNCTFKGLYSGLHVANAKYFRSYNNDFHLCIGFAHHNYPDADDQTNMAWTGGKSYNHVVANIDRGNWLDNASAYTESTLPHRDFYQFNWGNAGPPPTGTAPVNKLCTVVEDNLSITKVVSYLTTSGGARLAPDSNMLLTSDYSYDAARDIVLFNNVLNSNGFLTEHQRPSQSWIECNTNGVPPRVRPGPSDGLSSGAYSRIKSLNPDSTINPGGDAAYVANNISAGIVIAGGTTVTDAGNNVTVTNLPSASVGSRPGDVFQGAFENSSHDSGFWQWASIPATETLGKDELRAIIIDQMTTKAGVTAGADFS